MKDFHLRSWLLSYDLSKISVKLVISLKHNIIFAKVLEIALGNKVIFFTYTHSLTKQKSFGSLLSVYFPILYQRYYLIKMFLKMHWKNSMRPVFKWLTKLLEIIKLYKRSFCRCYSLRFYISMFSWTIQKY